MSRTLDILGVAVILLVSMLSVLTGGCKNSAELVIGQPTELTSSAPPEIAPYIDPAYYECIQVLPVDLESAYYTAYGNHAEAETMYNGKIFVFKNQLVDPFMLRQLDQGWIWADLVKCPLINLDYARTLKPGDKVDIVGICMGRDLKISPGLYFRDCYVLPAGALQLPAPGGGAGFTPVY